MEIIYNSIFLEHNTGIGHYENRKRLEAFGNLPQTQIENGEKYIELIHTKEYIERIKEACQYEMPLDSDTQTSARSFEVAAHAVGAAVTASQRNGFALVRPPGHHAYPDYGSGFCLFNNIAIAVQKLVNEGKRVCILDFDGHLGDGTLKIFYNTDKVLFWSLHQYPAFPGGGGADEIGEGSGKGYSMNVPLLPGSGDDIFMHAIHNLMAIVDQFAPDVLAVSVGFDAYKDDPLLQLGVSATTYYEIGKLLKGKFNNIFAVLEGGYNTDYLPKCAFNFLAGINGDKIFYEDERTRSAPAVIKEYERRIAQLVGCLMPYWQVKDVGINIM